MDTPGKKVDTGYEKQKSHSKEWLFVFKARLS